MRSLARARRAWATWRAVSPTNSITATSTVLSSSTRPWRLAEQRAAVEAVQLDEPADDGDDDRRPGDPVEPAHGVDEVLLAGPGEHDAGEQHDAADPDRHRQGVGDAGDDAEDRPGRRRSGDRPSVTTASVGMAIAGSCVVGSITRSGAARPRRRRRRARAGRCAARPGPPGVEQVEPARRVEPVAERLVVAPPR